jgi:hypothetical protein
MHLSIERSNRALSATPPGIAWHARQNILREESSWTIMQRHKEDV